MSNVNDVLDSIGESLLKIFDPDDVFRGYTKDWPLTDFASVFYISLGYVTLTIVGSTIMKLSIIPPMDLYPIKFFYNTSQIFFNSYFSIEALMIAYRNSYGFTCNTYDRTNPKMAGLMWLFYLSKIWDFWDTIFIVMGKKWKQLSFLHVYHHCSVILICWLQLNVYYDGNTYLVVLLNAFIHSVMYTYYFICMHTKDPVTGKSLPIWWKSFLTRMQMIQFITLMSSGVVAYLRGCDGYNHRVSMLSFGYTATLLVLFALFFVQAYGKRKKK